MDNIIKFPVKKEKTRIDRLEDSGLRNVIIIAYDEDGMLFTDSSEDLRNDTTLYMLEQAKDCIMETE